MDLFKEITKEEFNHLSEKLVLTYFYDDTYYFDMDIVYNEDNKFSRCKVYIETDLLRNNNIRLTTLYISSDKVEISDNDRRHGEDLAILHIDKILSEVLI